MPMKSSSSGAKFQSMDKKTECKVLSLDFSSYSFGSQLLNWISKNCFPTICFRKLFNATPTKNLREILKSRSLTKSFRFFLQQEFSEENLDFWLEIEKYRKDKTNRQQRANKIFQTFVQVESPKEINIDSCTRQVTISNMMKPNRETFNLAQDQVYILMERDSFPRFIAAQEEQKTSKKNKNSPKHEREINQTLSKKIKIKSVQIQNEVITNHHSCLITS